MTETITEKNWREFVPSIDDVHEFMVHDIEDNQAHRLETLLSTVGGFAYQELGPIRAIVDAFVDHFRDFGKPNRIVFTLADPRQAFAFGIMVSDDESWQEAANLFTGAIVTAVSNDTLLTWSWDVQTDDKNVDRYVFEMNTDPDTHMQQIAYCRADKIDMMLDHQILNVIDYSADNPEIAVHYCEWHEMMDEIHMSMQAQAQAKSGLA